MSHRVVISKVNGYTSAISVKDSIGSGVGLEFESKFDNARNPEEYRTLHRMFFNSVDEIDALKEAVNDARALLILNGE